MTGDTPLEPSPASPDPASSAQLRARAEAAIERTLRPLIAVDGGELQIVTWQDGSVVVRLVGSCSGCPGRPYTMARLIEPVLRQVLGPGVDISLEPG